MRCSLSSRNYKFIFRKRICCAPLRLRKGSAHRRRLRGALQGELHREKCAADAAQITAHIPRALAERMWWRQRNVDAHGHRVMVRGAGHSAGIGAEVQGGDSLKMYESFLRNESGPSMVDRLYFDPFVPCALLSVIVIIILFQFSGLWRSQYELLWTAPAISFQGFVGFHFFWHKYLVCACFNDLKQRLAPNMDRPST